MFYEIWRYRIEGYQRRKQNKTKKNDKFLNVFRFKSLWICICSRNIHVNFTKKNIKLHQKCLKISLFKKCLIKYVKFMRKLETFATSKFTKNNHHQHRFDIDLMNGLLIHLITLWWSKKIYLYKNLQHRIKKNHHKQINAVVNYSTK